MDRPAGLAGVRVRSEGARRSVRRWGVPLATVCLWLLIAASAASGLLSLIAMVRLSRVEEGRQLAPPLGAEGFAQLFVATYLEAGEGAEKALRPFYSKPLSLKGVRPGQRYVVRTAALEAAPAGRPPGADSWSVTVAAEVLVEAEGGYRRDGIHYFTVDVAHGEGGFMATSLPAEIPGSAILPVPPVNQ